MDYFIWEFMFKTSHSSDKIVCQYVRIEWESTCLTWSSTTMTYKNNLFFRIYLIHFYWNEMKWYISGWGYMYFVIFSCWPNIDEFDFFRMIKQRCKFFWSDSKHKFIYKKFFESDWWVHVFVNLWLSTRRVVSFFLNQVFILLAFLWETVRVVIVR